MELLAKRFNQPNKKEKYHAIAEKAKASFSNKFWNPRKEYLFDVIADFGADASLRPNQLIAASLDFSIVDLKMAEKIVDVAWKRLWGKYGLKTLPDNDPRYIGSYLGSWNHRDSAYHNGTVWPWLIGPFTTAFLKTKGYDESWRQFAFKNFLQPLFSRQISLVGLGTISEIFDGNEPHVPRGCISQAWSVAEPLRAYIEDITLNRPPHEKEVLNTF
jgi:glycogen debranching enzyme